MIDYDDELVLNVTPLVWPDSPEQAAEWENGVGEYSGPPCVPDWLEEFICSDAPLEEKRKTIDQLIRGESNPDSEPFVFWSLLSLSKLHADLEELRNNAYQRGGCDIHKGLGFNSNDSEFFTSMASYLQRKGSLSPSYIDCCRRTNRKGVSRLGKYHDQIIGLIALAAKCQPSVTPKLAKLLGIEVPRKKRVAKKALTQVVAESRESLHTTDGVSA